MKKDIKEIVKEKYAEIANQSKEPKKTSCCGSTGCCSKVDYTIFSEDYSKQKGYSKDADLGLGCGLPTEFAGIKEADHVLDLGSGAGNDCFVARAITGEKGKVTGIDFTDEMIEKAITNNKKMGYNNVEFIKGDIEKMPLNDNSVNVIISNCVLSLVPNKQKAFSEIYRVLKHEGHFCVSDIVLTGELPEKIKQDVAMYAGCVSGAIDKTDYLNIVKETGFTNIVIHKEKEVEIPESIMLSHLTLDEFEKFKKDRIGIFSITVTANK